MIKISAVIITLNEEKNIKRCIDSIINIVDEIVVIDSFSTDNTKKICESYHVKFYENKFLGYSAQKNYGITKANNPYILSLDADEALSERLKKSILEVKENWQYDAYSFNRLTNYCGKWVRFGGWYPDRKIRLWDSRKGNWGGLKVHEKLIFNRRVRIKHLKGDLFHYSYYSMEEHVTQANKYSTILAQSYFENGKYISILGIILRSIWRFLRDYVIKLGFLGGLTGLHISLISSMEVFLKYIKLYKLYSTPYTPNIKNICFLNSNKVWGGGEKWTLDAALFMDSYGYKVLVITNKNAALFKEVRKFETRVNLKSLKINTYSSFNYFRRKRFSRILKAHNIGSLVLNLSNDLKFGAETAYKTGVLKIFYRRAIPKPIKRKWYYNSMLRKYIDKIIVNSEQTKKGVLLNYTGIINPEMVKVIYNGIEVTDGYAPVNKKEHEPIVIGSAGRLSKEKGHHYLVELAILLKKKGIPFKIKIAGEGKCRKYIEKEILKNNLQEEIELLGFVKNIKAFYQSIDIFVLPSIWEGFGFVLLEAMSFCLPVVAFDTGSSFEIIEDGVNGFVVPDFNVNHLAEKVDTLYNNKELRVSMGNAGYKILKERFSIEKTFSEFKRVVEE
ncbi:MAG: glycosyltransferase [Bacteroidales bacterium]